MSLNFTVRFPDPQETYDTRWASDLTRSLRDFQDSITSPVESGYTLTNVTTDRTLDANSTTLAEVADVLGTLIQDLINAGHLEA